MTAVDAAGDQLMAGLDSDQAAEATAEHEDRPEPQGTAASVQDDAQPTDGIAVEDPEFLAVGVGRQPGG